MISCTSNNDSRVESEEAYIYVYVYTQTRVSSRTIRIKLRRVMAYLRDGRAEHELNNEMKGLR